MNLLKNTRCYLSCPMEKSNSSSWTDHAQKELEKLNIKVLNPYKPAFCKELTHNLDTPLSEDEKFRTHLKNLRDSEKLEQLYLVMKNIVSRDLAMVDRSDFFVGLVNPDVPMYGGIHEIVSAWNLKKPVFLQILGGLNRVPFWLSGLIKPRYLYKSFDDIIGMIKDIDSGRLKVDSERWKVLIHELR